MNTKRLPVHFLVAGTLASSLFLAPPAFSANKCANLFDQKEVAVLSLKLGVRQTGKEGKPLGIQVVESRYKVVENTINAIATWAFGRTLKLPEINQIMTKFLADRSERPFFVRLAEAFDTNVQYDVAAFVKNLPPAGEGGVITANHPRNGKDGIVIAAAASMHHPKVKVVMTHFLENVPGMNENAIFLNPYGGRKAAEYNAARMVEIEEFVRDGGLVIFFASGEVSTKDPGSQLKPVDSEWKMGVMRLLRKLPDTKVIPAYVGGEAGRAFYEVRKKGLGLKTTIFHVRELADNSNRDFPLSFAPPIAGRDLLETFGTKGGKDMMDYLRSRTYLMNEQASLQAKAETKQREMMEVAKPQDAKLTHEDIVKSGQLVFADAKKSINVYTVDGSKMSASLLRELGIARENSFRVVGEGSGKELDVDGYDRHYVHLIAVDTSSNKMLGGYRIGRIDQIMAQQGVEGVYSFSLFENRALLNTYGQHTLELGRSWVDFEAGSKAIIALDRMWKGIGGYLTLHPEYRYLVGPVSISEAYSTTSKLLIMSYLKRQMDPELSKLIHGRSPMDLTSQFQKEIDVVAAKTPDLKELNKLVVSLDGNAIPPLLISYGKMGAKYLGFNRDKEFNTVDGLIMVDLLSPEARDEAMKHFGDNWAAYENYHGPK